MTTIDMPEESYTSINGHRIKLRNQAGNSGWFALTENNDWNWTWVSAREDATTFTWLDAVGRANGLNQAHGPGTALVEAEY